MVAGLKTMLVKEGRQFEVERLFGELRAQMRMHEQGCLRYALCRSFNNPRLYIVQEQYRDRAALAAHEASELRSTYLPKIRELLESVTVEYFDVVVA